MADPDRRIVVEGVEFAQLVQFPQILRAVTAAFQPPRLLLGLLMVTLLVSVGRLWDWAFGPSVAPAGLMAAPWTDEDTAASQEILLAALQRYVPDEEQPEALLDPRDVIERVQSAHAERRRALVDDAEQTGPAALRRADEEFLDTIAEIDRVRPRGVFEATSGHATGAFNSAMEGLASLRLDDFFAGLRDLFIRTPIGVWRHDSLFAVAYGLFFMIVLALGGGSICRLAAADIAHQEKLRVQEALDFAVAAWRRLIFCLLLPLLLAGILSAVLLVGGFFLMLPWIDVVGGLLYGVALLIGFVVVFLLVGYAAGFSLLVPAVACENCDAADAQQRAYAYVLNRPLHLLGYGFVGCAAVAIGFIVASLFAVAILNVTGTLVDAATANAAVSVSHGFSLFDLAPQRATALPMAMHSEASAWFVMLWQTVVICLVAGYVFANYFTASTIIYLLMRRAVDGQDLSEIWEPGVVPGTTIPESHLPQEPAGAEGQR